MNESGQTERRSFCRLCTTHCGMIVTVDADEQLVGIRPDRDDLLSHGFACYKGLQAVDAYNSAIRLRHPLKRMPDGSFVEIALEQALDEIAERMRAIIDRDGAEAVGAFRGTGAGMSASACFLVDGFLQPLGSHKIFSSITIDQSAKNICAERQGYWPAGTYPTTSCDVVLLIGVNPLVSMTHMPPHDPMRRMKAAVAGGQRILMIDPRRTETARFAELHLQLIPGEDCTVLAGMIRAILANGWEDREFLDRHAVQLDELRRAVEPFTPEYVAARAGVDADAMVEMARIFSHAPRAVARSGTGPNMALHSNLAEHLVGDLNILCGCYPREGEQLANPGILKPRFPRPAQVVPPNRRWEQGFKSRVGGYGLVRGEVPTGILADEILTPGPGQIKALLCHGGNAAVVIPDQAKIVAAMRALELMVTIDIYWNATCALSDYVLPALMPYERPDLPCWQAEQAFYAHAPFARYTPAVVRPPRDAKLATDEYILWSLAKRLGVQMQWLGRDLDMDRPPETDELLRMVVERGPVSLETLKSLELGKIFDEYPQYVEPGDPGPEDRFHLCPPDVAAEMADVLAEGGEEQPAMMNGARPTHRFIVRRHRDMWNSTQRALDSTRRRLPYNVASIHPDDLAAIGVQSGDPVRITTEIAAVSVIADADPSLRPGTVSMVHGFGVLPEQNDYLRHGVSSNVLIPTRRAGDHQTINAMPLMSSFPVHICRADRVDELVMAALPSESDSRPGPTRR